MDKSLAFSTGQCYVCVCVCSPYVSPCDWALAVFASQAFASPLTCEHSWIYGLVCTGVHTCLSVCICVPYHWGPVAASPRFCDTPPAPSLTAHWRGWEAAEPSAPPLWARMAGEDTGRGVSTGAHTLTHRTDQEAHAHTNWKAKNKHIQCITACTHTQNRSLSVYTHTHRLT